MLDSTTFPLVFDQLKQILAPLVPPLVVTADGPDDFSLAAPPSSAFPKGVFFGAAQIKKNYVTYHLMPVYIYPSLLTGLSEGLTKRMQGKSCFNFTNVDPALLAELQKLTLDGLARCREGGRAEWGK